MRLCHLHTPPLEVPDQGFGQHIDSHSDSDYDRWPGGIDGLFDELVDATKPPHKEWLMETTDDIVLDPEMQVAPDDPLAGAIEALREALADEQRRYAKAQEELAAEHEGVIGRITAALDVIVGPLAATNGHVRANADALAALDAIETVEVDLRETPSVERIPIVKDSDVVIDPRTATVRQFIRAVMATRPGEVWRAEEVLERMKKVGYSGGSNDISRLGTVRTNLSQMVRARELLRPVPGDYILPRR